MVVTIRLSRPSWMTNREIATKLFLLPRTVETHVSHILTKLGVASRTDIAREVTRRSGQAWMVQSRPSGSRTVISFVP
jgi:hypothetical protein